MIHQRFWIPEWPEMPSTRPASTRSWPRFPITLEIASWTGYDGLVHDELVLCDRADKPIEEARPDNPTTVFERFVDLADTDDYAVLMFARIYGTLGLCRHGVPLTIVGGGNCTRHSCRASGDTDAGPQLHLEAERPEDWRKWARRFKGAIEIARSIRDGRPPSPGDVEAILEPADHFDSDNTRTALLGGFRDGPPPPVSEMVAVGNLASKKPDAPPWGAASEQVEIMRSWYFWRQINRWVAARNTAPTVTYLATEPGRLRVEAGPADLFSTLALQLGMALTETPSMVLCAACHRPTGQYRQPHPTDRAWCTRPECRRIKAQLASQRHRDKKRAQRQTMFARHRSA